jgi:hypothetical protein
MAAACGLRRRRTGSLGSGRPPRSPTPPARRPLRSSFISHCRSSIASAVVQGRGWPGRQLSNAGHHRQAVEGHQASLRVEHQQRRDIAEAHEQRGVLSCDGGIEARQQSDRLFAANRGEDRLDLRIAEGGLEIPGPQVGPPMQLVRRHPRRRVFPHLQPQGVRQDAKAGIELVGKQRRAAPRGGHEGHGITGMQALRSNHRDDRSLTRRRRVSAVPFGQTFACTPPA